MYLDQQLNIEATTSNIEPAWKAVKKSQKDYITWFQETRPIIENLSQYRIQTFVNNLLWYTGEYDKTSEYRIVVPGRSDITVPRKMLPRIFNHLHDITEQRVSKLSRLQPSFEVVPTNQENKDRLVSRLLKVALEAMKRRVLMDFLMQEVERWNSVFGEMYVGIEWDADIGDRVGKGKLERVGDVKVYPKAPWTILPFPCRHWDEVKSVIDIESIMHIEEARVRFNKKSLEPDNKNNIFVFNANVDEKRGDEVVVYRVITPPCKYLPEGDITYIVNDTIVDRVGEYPYSHYGFPFERHTDIDVPGRLFPQSFYQQVKPIQHVYNKLTSIITRNILLTAHPHILMPKGAAKIEAFGNAPTAIEYQGAIAPQVVSFSSVPQEAFQFRNDVRNEMGQVSGIQGVSRGAPPAGARAASMLRFYEEQEEQRASTSIIKHNELIRRIYIKAGSVIGDYYPTTSKERLLRVVGKENEYDIQAFEKIKISSEYDVVIINSSGFSESKATRYEEIASLLQMAPGILSNDQIAEVLEFKNIQKAYDITTASLKQAEDENERVLNGKDINPPREYQDLIAHWKTHINLMNSSTYENSIPSDIKERLEDHVMMTERLMEEKANLNATFAQELSMLRGYPAFWTPTPQLSESKPQQEVQEPINQIQEPAPLPPQNGAATPPMDMQQQQPQIDVPSALTNTGIM